MQPDEFTRRFAVSRETLDRFNCYEHLLRKRSQSLSLVGRSTLDDIWTRHFADSAQLIEHVGTQGPLLDMGTGGGFPGLVLAIMGVKDVHLSDNNQKKIAFLEEVAFETRTQVTIHNCKVEAIRNVEFGLLLARGLSPLAKLLASAEHLLNPDTKALFLKGRRAAEEVTEASRSWNFQCKFLPSLTSADSSILHLSTVLRREAA